MCSNLPKFDYFSDSDPFLVIYQRGSPREIFKEIKRTRAIKNKYVCEIISQPLIRFAYQFYLYSNNPKFPERISLHYYFQEQQEIKIDVYDQDSKNMDDLSKHTLMGNVSLELSELIMLQG